MKEDDPTFFEELEKVRKDYRVHKTTITKSSSRKKVVQLIMKCFKKHSQNNLSADGLQLLRVLIELAVCQELQTLEVILRMSFNRPLNTKRKKILKEGRRKYVYVHPGD